MAWWSRGDTFDREDLLTGPFLLIDPSASVNDEYQEDRGRPANVAFPVWVGVPAGVFVGDTLYLYYSAAPNVVPTTGEQYLDTVSDADLAACLADYIGGVGFRTCTVVARFSAATLAAAMFGVAEAPPESDWTNGSALESEIRYPTRFWAALPGTTCDVVPLAGNIGALVRRAEEDGDLDEPGVVDPWFVDAVPTWCVDQEQLLLWISAQPAVTEGGNLAAQLDTEGTTGFGIYRCRALPEGAGFDAFPDYSLEGLAAGRTSMRAMFGRDFVSALRAGAFPATTRPCGRSPATRRRGARGGAVCGTSTAASPARTGPCGSDEPREPRGRAVQKG